MSTSQPHFTPLVREILPAPDVEQAFSRLARLPHVVFFDSARHDAELGRYSFMAADPFAYLRLPADGGDALAELSASLAAFACDTLPDLPPFQGGAAGLFGYELGRSFERLPPATRDPFQVPALAVGLYDVVLAFDHVTDRAWIISQGFPEQEFARRTARAALRLEEMTNWLTMGAADGRRGERPAIDRLPLAQLGPQFAVAGAPGLTSNFSRHGYLQAVQQAIQYIRSGDIFQVNLSQQLLAPATDSAEALYLRLRQRNAAPFGGYFDLGDFQIASASPERFVQVRNGRIETRPIKGTRRRLPGPEADLFAGDDLRQSEKDRAENVMIVDLLRNDLSRVCRPESVFVSQLCGLETYATVQHLVSVVQGQLRAGLGPLNLLRAAFPGGSITGAPKVRAMEIIAELEPTARGAYCGCLGYIGFDGAADTSILIRTITQGRGWRQLPVGGGIVVQSVAEREYEETWHKAAGMLRALEP